MKRSWLLHLLIAVSAVLLVSDPSGAAIMVRIIQCYDCHGTNPQTNISPFEGAERNNPARAIIGSHSYHVNTLAMNCADCHVVPSALDHRNGKIEMAASMHNGVSYSAASGGVVVQKNQLSSSGLGTCSGGTGGCHSSASPVWGTVATCRTCHGYPPVTTVGDQDNKHAAGVTTPVNHIGTGATVNFKDTFVSTHGGCQMCHGTQSTTDGNGSTHDPYPTYNVATQHNTGGINMNGPTGSGIGYNSVNHGCDAACHLNNVAHQMTASGLPVVYGEGPTAECIVCHSISQSSPIAASLDSSVTSRPAITGDFSLASRHIRSRTASPSVTDSDCCVCHMEGDVSTGSPNTSYHKNGYIELRDPDTGTTILGVTHSGTTATAGAYGNTAVAARPVRFSRNLASATIEADTAAIMVNLCLKCHDANGANSSLAYVSGGSPLKPFGATITANPSGNVLDVASQFASSNKSHHPVLVRTNNGYTNTGGTPPGMV